MHIIRQEQYDLWLQRDPEGFVDSILYHVMEIMPEEVRGIPLSLIRSMIEVAIKRAHSHGLVHDGQVMAFVSVMFEIAPNFDEEESLHRILSDRRLQPVERWEALFSDTPELSIAWERAAHPDFYDHNAWIDARSMDTEGA